MNVLGVGTDIVLINRIKRLRRFPDRIISRILRPNELKKYKCSRSKTECLAHFFSAKEAVFKSLGLINFGPVGFQLIEIEFENSTTGCAKLFGHLARSTRGRLKKIFISSIKTRMHVITQAISFCK
ncbi:MAG: 4'-phosphopantetheinyl transferase superfamily protein [Candidatus Omnitrophica bacterium]|nr:4'-phosphopantetheinyl transferase superfamily protein [Candidatus Omnitrophota bacterium]